VKVTKGKYDSFCSDFNCYLCAGVSFLSLGQGAVFGNSLTRAASELHERGGQFRSYLSNKSVIGYSPAIALLAKHPHLTRNQRVTSVTAFHEKAGRSQGNFGFILLNKLFLSRREATVAMLPSALSRSDSFARCMLGVLGSAGAAICLAPCSSALESGTWAKRLTQSPELGFGFCLSLPGTILTLVLPFCFTQLPLRSFGWRGATVRTLLRSPTGDATTPPAFSRSQRWLASSRFFHHARPASAPSA